MRDLFEFLIVWAVLWVCIGLPAERFLMRHQGHRYLRWLWDWQVTVGFAIHHNLLPEFIWIWEQRSPPPWRSKP